MTVNHAWMIKGWLIGQPNVPDEIIEAINTVIGGFNSQVPPNVRGETKPDLPKSNGEVGIVDDVPTSTAPSIKSQPSKPRNPDNVWEEWQLTKLIKMKEGGATASEIAEAVGKTPTQVNNKWTWHKIKINKELSSPGEAQAPSEDGA